MSEEDKNGVIDQSEYMFAETLKPADVKEKIVTTITEMKRIGTKYGDKRVAVLGTEQQIFLNAMTLQNLVEAFGTKVSDWVGKEIVLEVEVSERTQGKQAIVVSANTEEEEVEDKKEKKKK